eukprot:SAG11_NODE_34954_length_269_cov_0.611765_1_plen_26_part_10
MIPAALRRPIVATVAAGGGLLSALQN